MNTSEKLAIAIDDLRSGELENAAKALRDILAADPTHVDALHYSGVLAHHGGNSEVAVAMIRRSLELNPNQAGALNNLGNILRAMGSNKEAIDAYFEALKIDPDHPDSWCNVGVLLRNAGNLAQAVEALERAVAVNPQHAESWHNLGMCLAMAGRKEEAAEAFRRCAACAGDSDWYPPVTHAYVLASMGNLKAAEEILLGVLETNPAHESANHMMVALRGENPEQAPEGFVRSHFDSFADEFDDILHSLEYRAPQIVAERVRSLAGDQKTFAEVLDLGCGTGLGGALIRPLCGRLTGIDLSRGMLVRAARRGVYDDLAEAELTAFLNQWPEGGCDLAVCIDTLCYIGALGPVFAGLRHALRPSASCVATVELHDGDAPDYRLAISGRYSHAAGYVRAAAADAGLSLSGTEAVVLRKEMGKPVDGLVFTLTRE